MEINLNLIPPYRREEIKKARQLKLIIRIELALVSFYLVFCGFLLGLGYILDLNMETASSAENVQVPGGKGGYEKIKNYDEKFKNINSQMSQMEKIKRDQLYWSDVFSKFSRDILPGIALENLATKEYAIFLVGKADSRDNLIAFKESLEKDDCFSNVNLPLSNLVSKGSIDFQMDLEVKKECVHRD